MNIQSATYQKSKGFVLVSVLIIYLLVISLVTQLVTSIKGYLYYYEHLDTFRKMNNIEVLVIERLNYNFRNYKEKDEHIIYDGCLINIEIEGTKATFTIACDELERERVYKYDVTNDVAEAYY